MPRLVNVIVTPIVMLCMAGTVACTEGTAEVADSPTATPSVADDGYDTVRDPIACRLLEGQDNYATLSVDRLERSTAVDLGPFHVEIDVNWGNGVEADRSDEPAINPAHWLESIILRIERDGEPLWDGLWQTSSFDAPPEFSTHGFTGLMTFREPSGEGALQMWCERDPLES